MAPPTDQIVPDDKDWTWVAEIRCPECGFDGPTVDPHDAPATIRAQAVRFAAVLARPDVGRRRRADRWSDLEYACHVRDVFRIYDGRLALMLDQDDPLFPNWDQDASAVDDRYAEQDPEAVGAELLAAGEGLATRYESIHGGQWDRPGRRSDGASFTIGSMTRYLLHDPHHHLWDVGALAG